jgi:serine-type D-Ala-D-Ala carboxypeptidase
MNYFDRAREILRGAVADNVEQIGRGHVCSAVQAVVAHGQNTVLDEALGHLQLERPIALSRDTPMDIASLTKLFTTLVVLRACDEGYLSPETPIEEVFPRWSDADDPVRVSHLLNHTSGLPAWEKFYLRYPMQRSSVVAAQTRDSILTEIISTARRAPATAFAYSDLGYILLGRLVEQVVDATLDELVSTWITRPLAMKATRFVNEIKGDARISNAAVTEFCPLRGGVTQGVVHDENAYVMGGVAGHAGLFSHAADLARLMGHLRSVALGLPLPEAEAPIVSQERLTWSWSLEAGSSLGSHLGGWDTPSGATSSAGKGFSAGTTVGHLGFTGTSLWYDRDADLFAILLTNRVYPTRENRLIKNLRIRFHEAVNPPPGVE